MLSYRFGGVFHPTSSSSLYVAYGNSYNPSAELGTLSSGTTSLDPEKNVSYEAGVKVDVLGGGLSLTGAVLGLLYRLGDDFANASPGDKLNVIPGMGSSGGISAVAEGALQVSFSGRDLRPQERARGLESSLPIRLTQTPTTCRVLPLSRVKFAEGRCPDVARDTKERAEGVERVEPPVEAECELVEVGL